MKHALLMTACLIFTMLTACSAHRSHHAESMPDPEAYNAHFGDMDLSGDDRVDWKEFKTHFEPADPVVFRTIDRNRDDVLDHDEWHAFKEAHGMRHHD